MTLAVHTPSLQTIGERNLNLFPALTELTVSQAATLYGVSEGHIDELLDDNLIEHRQAGGRRLINRDSLLAHKQENERRHAALDEMFREFREAGLSADYDEL